MIIEMNKFKLGRRYINKNKDDKPEDWLLSSLILSKAIFHLLKDKEGIIVKLENDMNILLPNIEKVIVFKENNQINAIPYHDIGYDGTLVWVHNK